MISSAPPFSLSSLAAHPPHDKWAVGPENISQLTAYSVLAFEGN